MAIASRDEKDQSLQSRYMLAIYMLDGYAKHLHQKRPRAEFWV
jgi:hypothetical protein